MRKKVWTLETRRHLEHLLSEGFSVNQIRELIGGATVTILKEIKRGVSEKEYDQKRFVKYSVEQAIINEVLETLGKEQFDVLVEAIKEQ